MPSANREERKNNDKCLQMDLLLTLLNFSCKFKFQECTLVKESFYAVFMVREKKQKTVTETILELELEA